MRYRITLHPQALQRDARLLSYDGRKEVADQIANDARSAAPVLTGAYAGGIAVEASGNQVRVVDNDDTAIHKEYGTSDTPAHAALTNAAANYGRYSGTRPR